jgi:hypothetical protein
MTGTVFGRLAAGQARWRRARNLRAGQAGTRPGLLSRAFSSAFSRLPAAAAERPVRPAALRWLTAACCLLAALGAVAIGVHARWIAASGDAMASGPAGLASLQTVLPGAAFTVPPGPAVVLEPHGQAALLILSGLRAEPARRIDLCSQMADPARGRLLPLRIGYPFDEVAALAARNASSSNPVALRNVVLALDAMPRVQISGSAAAPGLRWEGYPARCR